MTPLQHDFDLTTKSIAILAFVVAFYALIARERKTPYLTNRVFATIITVLFAVVADVLSSILKSISSKTSEVLHAGATLLFIIALAYVALGVFRVYNRQINLRDDHPFQNLRIIRRFRLVLSQLRRRKPYEFDTPALTPGLREALRQTNYLAAAQLDTAFKVIDAVDVVKLSLSAVIRVPSPSRADWFAIDLAKRFLVNDCPIQFVSCVRHPIEFIAQLSKSWQQDSRDWQQIRQKIVVVDAFSPHFGFSDTVHDEMTRITETDFSIKCLKSRPSYAGIHSASASAFNYIKQLYKTTARPYTLVLYEGAHSLVDLESREQYRLFVRHVIPSERVWGGMFTVFLELAIDDSDMDLLRSYADIAVDDTMKPRDSTADREGASHEINDSKLP
jgi:hypothetical protein